MTNYHKMEEPLKLINTMFISIKTEEIKHNNERLQSTLQTLIRLLKSQDKLFDKLFQKPYYGGSYYNDLKVGKADEFDLDLLLVLPEVCELHKPMRCACVSVTPSNKPGYFWFKVQRGYCTAFDRFIKDGYVQTDLVLNWLKSNINIALTNLKSIESGLRTYTTYFSECGPALTLQLYGDFGNMTVDLVPAFKFGSEHWPRQGFRANVTTFAEFCLVPKKCNNMDHGERYWRPSFQDQESVLIKEKERLKPSLRLLKKMRTNLIQTSISSYALKTIVLWEVDEEFNWNGTLSDTFMKLLEKYKDCLNRETIPYYWNKKNNLLDGINSETLVNHHNEISRLLNQIKGQYASNPCVVAKVILKEGTEDYNKFMTYYQRLHPESSGPSMPVGTPSWSSSYHTFDREATFSPLSATTSSFDRHNSGGATQQTTDSSTSGWTIAAGVLFGVGAAVGLTMLSNRNKNNN